MKKNAFLSLATLAFFSANAIDKQTYAEIPDYFPEAFSWQMHRNDFRGTDDAGNPQLVNVQQVEVTWDPNYQNGSACYGKLTVSNFFSHDWVQEAASIDFTNESNLNFQWSEDGTQCTFSFTGYYFSMAQTGPEYNSAFGKLSQYALLARAKKGTSSTYSRYWLDGAGSWYGYNGGMALDCVLDLVNKTITISQPWGAFMCKDRYGAPSSYVIEYYESSLFELNPPTTLAWIEKFGKRNTAYTVADQLVGVYAHEGSLWCKDQGNISIEKTTNPGDIDYMKGLMATMHGIDPSLEWDQSNWVELDFGTVTPERATQIKNTYVGHTIKAGTIQGIYADSINYRIEVSADPEVDGDLSYTPNYYCPVNFMGETEVSTTDKTFYFLNPKAQEWAIVTMAVWNGGDVFVVPAKDDASGVNSADLSGAFTVNWDLNCLSGDAVKPNLSTSTAYEFHAILRRGTVQSSGENTRYVDSVTGKAVTPNDKYVVYPLDLTDSSNISTAISDVRVERENTGDGYYYTITGQRVTNPTPGFYIHNGKKVIVR